MAVHTSIEWTRSTLNFLKGCSRVSEGCRHCYAEVIAARFAGPGLAYEGLAEWVERPGGAREARWTGSVTFDRSALLQAFRWKKPRMIFVNSTSDLFHPSVPDDVIDQFFAVAALTPWHTYQLLTKRPERMRDYMRSRSEMIVSGKFLQSPLADAARQISKSAGHPFYPNAPFSFFSNLDDDGAAPEGCSPNPGWPFQNIWLGVSVEDQATADARIPILLDTPAAIRWVSAEPLLGRIDLRRIVVDHPAYQGLKATLDALIGQVIDLGDTPIADVAKLDWVIVGGESGPGARPMHPAWPRLIRDDCERAGVAFFFKQWGAWMHGSGFNKRAKAVLSDGRILKPDQASMQAADRIKPVPPCDPTLMLRTTKKAAGRELDGRIHHAFPAGAVANQANRAAGIAA